MEDTYVTGLLNNMHDLDLLHVLWSLFFLNCLKVPWLLE